MTLLDLEWTSNGGSGVVYFDKNCCTIPELLLSCELLCTALYIIYTILVLVIGGGSGLTSSSSSSVSLTRERQYI